MSEHAQFIDDMIVPTEKTLKEKAALTAKEFEKLVKECIDNAKKTIAEKSKKVTEQIIVFKTSVAQGLQECKIKSIIAPLLADYVLSEANYYLRLLKVNKS